MDVQGEKRDFATKKKRRGGFKMGNESHIYICFRGGVNNERWKNGVSSGEQESLTPRYQSKTKRTKKGGIKVQKKKIREKGGGGGLFG